MQHNRAYMTVQGWKKKRKRGEGEKALQIN